MGVDAEKRMSRRFFNSKFLKMKKLQFVFFVYLFLLSYLSNAQVDVPGTYTLTNKNSNLCLAVRGATQTSGEEGTQWACDGNADKNWNIIDIGGGYYKLQNRNSNHFLAVGGGSRAQGGRVVQYVDQGQQDILWRLINIGGGYYKAQNKNSGLFLAIGAGSRNQGADLVQWGDAGQEDVKWKLDKLFTATSTPTQTILGNYRILNRHSNKFVGISGANITNGAQAIQWDNNNQSDIEWDFMPNANGTYRIRNMNSGRYLTAQNDGKVVQFHDTNRNNVNWILVPLSDGEYKIKNNTTGKFLAVSGAALYSGAEIITWDDNNQTDIKWSLSLVSPNETFDLRAFTVYAGCNYPNGEGVVINEGHNPNVFDRTSRVSSVQSGNLKLALYEYSNFQGECLVLPLGANNPCIDVGHRFHLASSIIATRR